MSLDEAKELVKSVTKNMEKNSIEKFINSRIDIENKNRNGGKCINSGRIAQECMESYRSDPIRYRYGKGAFRLMKSALQDRKLSLNRLIYESKYLCDPDLALVFKKVDDSQNGES